MNLPPVLVPRRRFPAALCVALSLTLAGWSAPAQPAPAPPPEAPFGDAADSPPVTDAPPPARWDWPVEVFFVGGYGDEGDVFAAHLGTEWEIDPTFSLAPQLVLAVTENTDDATSLLTGVDLMGRWTAWRTDRWRVFLEAGAGVQYVGPESFPRRGTHANFRLRGGVAAAYALDPGTHLLAGVNWLHMSNAGVLDPNNGHDGPMFYLGLRLTY